MVIAARTVAVNASAFASHFQQLLELVRRSVAEGAPFALFEVELMKLLVTLGRDSVDLVLASQGDGDLGPTVEIDGVTLARSEKPHVRELRTLFGNHVFHAYVYGRDLDRKIEARPIDARLQLSEGKFSPRFVEVSQMLCVETAFARAAEMLELVFGTAVSVNSLERSNRELGTQAEEFLQQLPVPKAVDEGEVLVVTADGKGVPMVRDAVKVPAFERREHPGNRKMATLASVYSVDRFVCEPEQIVSALFRDTPEEEPAKRPVPVGKTVVGYLTDVDDEGEPLPGDIQAFAWAAEQVARRHREDQPLVRLMDGQASLWTTATVCLEGRAAVDVLDIIHVSSYVWSAAKQFHPHREHQEAYARDRLLRILHGEVAGVIAGMRRQATLNLSAKGRAAVERICNYFETNCHRMKYDEYLKAGYPIATGVIEGACRHLVMDRMCRTGMRWQVLGSQAMLHVRAVHQADHAKAFHAHLATRREEQTAPLRRAMENYAPACLCG